MKLRNFSMRPVDVTGPFTADPVFGFHTDLALSSPYSRYTASQKWWQAAARSAFRLGRRRGKRLRKKKNYCYSYRPAGSIIDYRLSFSCIFLLTNVLKFIFYIEILNYRLLLSISITYICYLFF